MLKLQRPPARTTASYNRRSQLQFLGWASAAAVGLTALGGCGGGGDTSTVPPSAASCTALQGRAISGSAIGTKNGAALRSGDALLSKATYVPGSPLSVTASGVVTPALPESCQITGQIAPVDPSAQSIGFQINLPTVWNGKSLQIGGGGFNGVLITAIGQVGDTRVAPPAADTPLNRGYMTLGTDSGHVNTLGPLSPKNYDFASNDEMLRNFASESYKKVHDLGIEVSQIYYGSVPKVAYYTGTSEGGREAMAMVQRFPLDFQGVYSNSPVIYWTGLFNAMIRSSQQLLRSKDPSGVYQAYLNAAEIKLLYTTVLSACDADDGIVDGVVGSYLTCQPKADAALAARRCPGGTYVGDGTCFSQKQLDEINLTHSPMTLPFQLANGVTTYPGWSYGGESITGGASNSYALKTGAIAGADFGQTGAAFDTSYGYGYAKYFIAQSNTLDVTNAFDPSAFSSRIQQVSTLMDFTNPDISVFLKAGGKLIMQECSGDYAQSPYAGFLYYQSLLDKFGKTAVDASVRLYVTPSANHGCDNTIVSAAGSANGVNVDGAQTSAGTLSGMPTKTDWLPILESWVERGAAPGTQVDTTIWTSQQPFTVLATKPICTYPLFPKYIGGRAELSTSYTCTNPGQ